MFTIFVFLLNLSNKIDFLSSENKKLSKEVTDVKAIYESVINIPQSIEFCGQEISTENPYVRERLQRELINLRFYKNQLELYKRRAKYFFPIIEYYLNLNNLPDDLKYLAVHESALNAKAISRANAVGLWQFMAPTAKEYGLKMTHYIDERRHPIKATIAACKYLDHLHKKFNDWPLAIAAYNTGENRVERSLKKQAENNYFGLSLPEETERYFFKILATYMILGEYEKEIKQESQNTQLQPVELVVENDLLEIKEICTDYDIDYRSFYNFNPQFRRHLIPYGRHIIMIPKNHIKNNLKGHSLYFVQKNSELNKQNLTQTVKPEPN
jgi:hypothetical protein